jgi:putative transcriptional regulator
MSTKRNYKSDAFEAIHSAAEGLFKAGGFSKETMRDFDESCLEVPQQLGAKKYSSCANHTT